MNTKAVLDQFTKNPGTEVLGYAAADVNFALIAAKAMTADAFPGATIPADPNNAASTTTLDPGVVLQIAELILTRLAAIEKLADDDDDPDGEVDEAGDDDDEDLDADDDDDDDDGGDDDDDLDDEGEDDDPDVEDVSR